MKSSLLKKSLLKKVILFAAVMALVICCGGCSEKLIPEEKYPVVTMELENGGIVTMKLYPNHAPNTVANFVTLIQSGYYDGLTFHRAVPGFVVQGGSPNGTGSGNPGYSIAGEFVSNKFTDNRLWHDRGVLSMARNNISNDTAGSQFFICLKDDITSLDGLYAGFGMVTSGMEYIDEIAALEAISEQIVNQPVIKKMTVETFGVKYKVEKMK